MTSEEEDEDVVAELPPPISPLKVRIVNVNESQQHTEISTLKCGDIFGSMFMSENEK